MTSAEQPDARSRLERALSVITEVRPGEGATAAVLTLNVFILLCAYYVIKPVREGLILAMPGGAEKKSLMSAAIAVTLLVAVPLYGRIADRVRKDHLVEGVTLFFASHLLVFFSLSQTSARSQLGLAFFVWVGVFNMMLVAQFWAFANDLYSEEKGKRLFAIVGLGASGGAVAGAYLTKLLVSTLGTYVLLLVAAGLLGVSALLTHTAARWERRSGSSSTPSGSSRNLRDPSPPVADAGRASDARPSSAFALVWRHKYLAYIAAFSVLFTLVNTNGEYMLGSLVSAAAKQAGTAPGGTRAHAENFATAFYGEFFLYVNASAVLIQMFVVSRLVKRGGLPIAFFVLPAIALLDALGIALIPILAVVRAGKMAENAVDYSVNNTVRNMLWLPTTTDMKYKAKQAVDTFFVRMGDVGSWVLVELGAHHWGWSVKSFALVNVVLVGGWLLTARGIVRENALWVARRSESDSTT